MALENISLKQRVESRRLSILVEGKGQTSGILSIPEKTHKKTAIIVAHGAGNDMNNPLIASFAEGLSASGYPTLRFNFLYKERGGKAPDNEETLVKTWQSAYRTLEEVPGLDIDGRIAAGKSMGGRIASQMVADGLIRVDRLIFLGYPLHPANNKVRLRDTHLYRIKTPMLFFAGTRDRLCDLSRLEVVLTQLRAAWDLHTIEGGDHSFHVPKSIGTRDEDVYRTIIEKTLAWLAHEPLQHRH
jgi:predicted alpha/beta-hydrolase family hydrolase